MEPVFGRFSVLCDARGALLFARLVEGPRLEVLATDVAFRADLSEPDMLNFRTRGTRQNPKIDVIALLLAIPSTSWELLPDNASESPSEENESRSARLFLRCTDRAELELHVSLTLARIGSYAILQEIHQAMFSTVAALEATIREAGGEKNSNFLDDKQLSSPSLRHVKDLLLPLTSMGQAVDNMASFRRAAAANVLLQGNRSFAVALTASNVRKDILAQRRARKEEEDRKKKMQRELVRQAKKRSELAKSRTVLTLPAPKKRKKTLFEVETPNEVTNDDKDRMQEAKEELTAPEGASVVRGETLRKEQHASNEKLETSHASNQPQNETHAVEGKGHGTGMASAQVPPTSRPPPAKKRKKRLRSLV